jgi:cell division septation protein DedD
MDYQFSFSKKRLILLAATTLFAGILIFVCGIVMGMGLTVPGGKPMAAGAAKGNPPAQLAAAKGLLKVPPVPGGAAVLKAAANPAGAAPAGKSAAPASAAGPAAAPAAGPAPAAAPTAAPTATTAAAGQPADPAAPTAVAGAVAAEPGDQPFVLQLGAFREQKNAKLLQTALKEKGYATIILNMVDDDQRTWHMVRLGGYKDLRGASKAASDFTGKEGIQALVRRSDSL